MIFDGLVKDVGCQASSDKFRPPIRPTSCVGSFVPSTQTIVEASNRTLASNLKASTRTNMAEPIPSASAAADAGEDETTQNLPANAEDRKAAAALNALNANNMSQENGESATKQHSAADQEALGKAMSRLEMASGVSKKKDDGKKAEAKKEVEVKKKIKVAADDVNFLVGRSLARVDRSLTDITRLRNWN